MFNMSKRRPERSRIIGLRLTPAEYRELLAAADKMYLPLSAYMRQRLFRGNALVRKQIVRKRRGA
jgi:hypothetical protein